MKAIKAALALTMCLIPAVTFADTTFVPGTDITSQLNAAIAAGENGIGPNKAVITLPAGSFRLTGAINLHGSTLIGAGANQTVLCFFRDLGSNQSGFTGDVAEPFGNFEIDSVTIEGPRPSTRLFPGDCPNKMDGIRLLDNCVLKQVNILWFDAGVVMDGNHHTLNGVCAEQNYNGIEYVVSSDGTYYDDYIADSSFVSNGRAGVAVDDNVKFGGATMLRTHTGYEPYSFYLGHLAAIANCQFLQTQFEGVGNADIADSDGTSVISGNQFSECSGWGSRYNNAIASEPTSPSMRCGSFLSNTCFSSSMMGPTPGDMSARIGLYGNTWLCDPLVCNSLLSGTISPIIAPVTNCYANTLIIAGTGYTSSTADVQILPGAIVQSDGGRYQGCVPVTRTGVSIGQNLALAPPGTVAWIATPGATAAAMKGHLVAPQL